MLNFCTNSRELYIAGMLFSSLVAVLSQETQWRLLCPKETKRCYGLKVGLQESLAIAPCHSEIFWWVCLRLYYYSNTIKCTKNIYALWQ